MLIATNKSAAKALGKDFQTPGRVGKEYVARVAGHFAPQMKFENEEEGLVCEEPILTIDKQIGVNVVHPEGRVRKAIFI